MVGSLDVYEVIAAGRQFGLGDEVAHDMVVFHLRQADERTSHLRQDVRPHLGQYGRHVVQLVCVLHLIPMVTSVRCEIIVVLPFVVCAVEQIFLVVEADGVNGKLLLRRGGRTEEDGTEKNK